MSAPKVVSIAPGWRMDGVVASLRALADQVERGEVSTLAFCWEAPGEEGKWEASGPRTWKLLGLIAHMQHAVGNSLGTGEDLR